MYVLSEFYGLTYVYIALAMSAQDRSARHAAVCGNREGGAHLYYLKESCTLKTGARTRTGAKTIKKDSPMLDYGKYCLDKANKIRLFIEKTSTRADYPVDLTDDAVQGVTLQILSKEMTRERELSFKRKLEQAVRLHNIHMDETDQPEHKAEICEQLYHEVPALLEFHYSGVVATLSGSGRV
jgi:hypothetical protein